MVATAAMILVLFFWPGHWLSCRINQSKLYSHPIIFTGLRRPPPLPPADVPGLPPFHQRARDHSKWLATEEMFLHLLCNECFCLGIWQLEHSMPSKLWLAIGKIHYSLYGVWNMWGYIGQTERHCDAAANSWMVSNLRGTVVFPIVSVLWMASTIRPICH